MKNEYLFIDLLELILEKLVDEDLTPRERRRRVEEARRKIMQLIEEHLTK